MSVGPTDADAGTRIQEASLALAPVYNSLTGLFPELANGGRRGTRIGILGAGFDGAVRRTALRARYAPVRTSDEAMSQIVRRAEQIASDKAPGKVDGVAGEDDDEAEED